MKYFIDKTAVITGAASGIGRSIAERCVQEGIKVVLADIEEEALMQTKRDLESMGADVLAIVTDVSKAEEVEHLAHEAFNRFGAVHLLFNNAGVGAGSWLWESTVAEWEWVLGVNLWGVIHGIHTFVPLMLEQDVDCHIVNTASLAGLISYPSSGIYKVTKHGVIALSETLYHELKQIEAKVQVSVLCPGWVNTQISESARNSPESTSKTPTVPGNGPNDTELAEKAWQRLYKEGLEPSQVAEFAFEAIRDERFYILTHPEYNEAIRARFEDIMEGRNPTNSYQVLTS